MDKVAHFFAVTVVAVMISLIFNKVDSGDTSYGYMQQKVPLQECW